MLISRIFARMLLINTNTCLYFFHRYGVFRETDAITLCISFGYIRPIVQTFNQIRTQSSFGTKWSTDLFRLYQRKYFNCITMAKSMVSCCKLSKIEKSLGLIIIICLFVVPDYVCCSIRYGCHCHRSNREFFLLYLNKFCKIFVLKLYCINKKLLFFFNSHSVYQGSSLVQSA